MRVKININFNDYNSMNNDNVNYEEFLRELKERIKK